ncbi:MAG: carbonic anhydrase [Candidatus Anammoxibacter sp.]
MRNYILIVFLAVLGFSFQTFAGNEDHKDKGSSGHTSAASGKIDAITGVGMIIKGNNKFVENHAEAYYANIKDSQHPFLTMVCCSDSRVHTNSFSFDPVDKVFAVRVIGNQFIVGEGSVDYGIHHLHTPVLLMFGHVHCGAVKAAMTNYRKESTFIISELDHLHVPLMLDDHKGSFESRWLKNVERNVDYQVELALHAYSDLVRRGKLTIIGAVDDFINAYGKGLGRIVITNINGEKNIEEIKKYSVFGKISNDLKNLSVGRVSNK